MSKWYIGEGEQNDIVISTRIVSDSKLTVVVTTKAVFTAVDAFSTFLDS